MVITVLWDLIVAIVVRGSAWRAEIPRLEVDARIQQGRERHERVFRDEPWMGHHDRMDSTIC